MTDKATVRCQKERRYMKKYEKRRFLPILYHTPILFAKETPDNRSHLKSLHVPVECQTTEKKGVKAFPNIKIDEAMVGVEPTSSEGITQPYCRNRLYFTEVYSTAFAPKAVLSIELHPHNRNDLLLRRWASRHTFTAVLVLLPCWS